MRCDGERSVKPAPFRPGNRNATLSLVGIETDRTMQPKPQAIELASETASIDKHDVLTGTVRVSTRTDTVTEHHPVTLDRQDLEITRVPVGREVAQAPPTRTEGDVTIIPVVEERVVVEKRLVLTEEVHVRRIVSQTEVDVPVELRKQRAVVERGRPPMSSPEDQQK